MFINVNKDIVYKIRYYAKHSFSKKFEIRTERPTKKKPTHLSGFLFILPKIFKKQTLKTEPESQNC